MGQPRLAKRGSARSSLATPGLHATVTALTRPGNRNKCRAQILKRPAPHQDASSFTFSQDKRAGRHRKNWSSFDLGDCNNKLLVAQQSSAT